MNRITRTRRLTNEEAGKYETIRAQVAEELPDLIARHHERMKPMVSKRKVRANNRRASIDREHAPKNSKCFGCDGTGQRCNVCGESEAACGCPEEERSFGPCPDCNGTGK